MEEKRDNDTYDAAEPQDETTAAGRGTASGKYDRLTGDQSGVRKLTGMYKN